MAFVQSISLPGGEINKFLNVSSHVGAENSPNISNDVRAVQGLIAIGYRTWAMAHKLGMPPQTGSFDIGTGFYILLVQAHKAKGHPGTVVDGIVSPAQGNAGSYGPNYWTIVYLNGIAAKQDRQGWEQFLTQFPST